MYKHLLLYAVAFISIKSSFSQGCSDAGICTTGSNTHYNKPSNDSTSTEKERGFKYVNIGLTQALGEEKTYIFTPFVEVGIQTTPHSVLSVKATANVARNSAVSKIGMGDVYIVHSTNFINKTDKHEFFLNLGGKFATNRGAFKDFHQDLPMYFQSSLGTFDFLVGFNYQFHCKLGTLSAAVGYQQPLININRNSSFSHPTIADYNAYSFNRKGDFTARLDKVFQIKKFEFGAGALYIYHIQNDEIEFDNGDIFALNGSKGHTLNITGLFKYNINDMVQIGVTGGAPVITRDVRPDGLTRKFVITPIVNFNF
ncbi:MAG: hypothetical protein H6553_07790 [Chitinophagales bacterium]|nr:hypothetical protein [Chitinophagales bacterium]